MTLLLHTPLIKVKATILLLTILLFAGCAPIISVQTTFDPSVNFKVYQTFMWHPAEVPAPKQGSSGPLYSTLLDQRVKEAIASELVKNGITPDADNPGLIVAYDIAIEPTQEMVSINLENTNFGYGYSYWYGYRYRYDGDGLQNFKNIGTYKPGSLVVDLIDRNTNRVVWRGALDAGIDPVTIDIDKISRSVARVMSQFPPVPSTVR
ncbi:DUF4136 domain-containing protein [Pontibacter cellulosilyticus]|uniref:DUF4136 domain-containing protein n=1 Tax=Pontibacter cellulosilyticus TaxID=1720253 RepID=A0A923SJE9_9BACT|nr:DUF4136 domain-containing protein [Pontibacter cellulosilyticus]MBC5993834.1 DUF4136 domain-containing protein [Pontibacter cellulosilyticus]